METLREMIARYIGKVRNSNVETPQPSIEDILRTPKWKAEELEYGRIRQGYSPQQRFDAFSKFIDPIVAGKIKKLRWKSGRETDLSKPLVRKASQKRVIDADQTEIKAMQDYYKDPGLREQNRWAYLTIKELIRSMRRGKK